jgi:L,D-peptidoglycan transpeptidase YkuD (ErfK/YbiS/YcfS/YnhG family)
MPVSGSRHLTPRRDTKVVVSARSALSTRGLVRLGVLNLPCALGRSGRRARKREGDGATPVGCWKLLRVFYRADRIGHPFTALPVQAIARDDGWCDAPGDRNYNRAVKRPYAASSETLWRADELYDVVVVLDHNTVPRIRGGGSAIFMHVAKPGYAPTEGCIALRRDHLLLLLLRMRAGARVCVRA